MAAAGLKAYELATGPAPGNSLLDTRWFLTVAVEFELFLGLCLLANTWPRLTWVLALCCFSLFAAVSLFRAGSGHATCGCFGPLRINPWYTAALDLAVIVSLLRLRPKGPESVFAVGDGRRPSVRVLVVLAMWLLIGLPIGYAVAAYVPGTLSDDGKVAGDDGIVVLEPEKWLGRRFPLLDHIDIGDRLKEGRWLVILYHHDCPRCIEALAHYESQAPELAGRPNGPRVALVEMPPFGRGEDGPSVPPASPFVSGKLSDRKSWFAQTPVVISMESARVRSVTTDPDTPLTAIGAPDDGR